MKKTFFSKFLRFILHLIIAFIGLFLLALILGNLSVYLASINSTNALASVGLLLLIIALFVLTIFLSSLFGQTYALNAKINSKAFKWIFVILLIVSIVNIVIGIYGWFLEYQLYKEGYLIFNPSTNLLRPLMGGLLEIISLTSFLKSGVKTFKEEEDEQTLGEKYSS